MSAHPFELLEPPIDNEGLTLAEEIAKARVLHAFTPDDDTRTKNQFTADALRVAGYGRRDWLEATAWGN